ncbi:MAG: toxin-antitoxin system HicB family antitoxin [Clostridia bacterium]|jgi:predicted HicB family RNase H-like nuclease|nr:toxin-antitoxin system HicB family antitoxin [Clostridia bacterium]
MSESKKFKIEKQKNTNVRIPIRVTPEMYEEIAQTAQENDISMNSLIISCIRYALDNKE